jgi:hypothetical protein
MKWPHQTLQVRDMYGNEKLGLNDKFPIKKRGMFQVDFFLPIDIY